MKGYKKPIALPDTVSKLRKLASRQIPMKVTEMVRLKTYNRQYSTYYVCPRCKISFEREFMSYCDRCGQKLDWTEYKSAKLRK